jgi:hypothetical protein
MKMTDDVFHGVIIALERLERFLLLENESKPEITAISTERDLHDDKKNPPTKKLLYMELQLQCSALYYQTRYDDPVLFDKTIYYFLSDLLMWYGGRSQELIFDDVDRFFIPIVSALSRQINDVSQLEQTVQKYVQFKSDQSTTFSQDEKRKAVMQGFEAFLKAGEIVQQRTKSFIESGVEVAFTVHQRGSTQDGLDRLYLCFLNLFEENTPVLFLDRTRKKYLADLVYDPLPVVLEYVMEIKNSFK